MKLYVSVDGDDIGRRVGLARLMDDVEEVRRVDQAITLGNEIWRSWALRSGGTVIEAGGDEVALEIGVDHIGELPKLAEQYAQAVGATISVGVGRKLSESSKALLVAKLRGKNQIVTWEPEMEAEIEAAHSKPKDEGAKLTEEYLLNKSGGAAPVEAAAPLAARPGAMQGDHEEVQEAVKTIDMLQPEMTHAAEDAESALHSMAEEQEANDGNKVIAEDNQKEQLKQQLAQILTMVKLQLPVIQQLQQTAPEAFQAIISLVQGVTALGREVAAPTPPVKHSPEGAEDDSDDDEGGDVQKAGEMPSAHHHLKLPVGSQKDNKVKVQHSDGKTGWKQMSSGAIQGLEADAPLFGANSHPVSARNPKSK